MIAKWQTNFAKFINAASSWESISREISCGLVRYESIRKLRAGRRKIGKLFGCIAQTLPRRASSAKYKTKINIWCNLRHTTWFLDAFQIFHQKIQLKCNKTAPTMLRLKFYSLFLFVLPLKQNLFRDFISSFSHQCLDSSSGKTDGKKCYFRAVHYISFSE